MQRAKLQLSHQSPLWFNVPIFSAARWHLNELKVFLDISSVTLPNSNRLVCFCHSNNAKTMATKFRPMTARTRMTTTTTNINGNQWQHHSNNSWWSFTVVASSLPLHCVLCGWDKIWGRSGNEGHSAWIPHPGCMCILFIWLLHACLQHKGGILAAYSYIHEHVIACLCHNGSHLCKDKRWEETSGYTSGRKHQF